VTCSLQVYPLGLGFFVKMKSAIVNVRHIPSLSSRPVHVSSCRSSLHLFLPTCRLTYGSPWTPRSQHSTS
ncbi:hypothetical protein COCCADRAFT_84870, partial [Bipolaris zeicola 26-R-13]